MAQHDYNIANQSGADFRADLNNALLAIATVNSGSTEPSTTFAHQLWVDTSSSVLKIRNAADNAWITTGVSITASNTFTGDLTGDVTGNLTGNVTGNVTGDLTGNADSADTLSTARTISLSGDVVGSVSFDGSTNVDIDTVVQINSITLGTDTTGDYVESMSGGTGVTVTGGTGEGSTPSIAIGQSVATTDNVTFNLITATDEFVGDIDGAVRFSAKADEALTKGDVIYITGVSGNTPTIAKAKADDASKMPAFGIAAEDANANTNLQIVTLGTIKSLDTSNESVGEILYVSTTAGEYTTTIPTGESSQIQNIGKVLRSHAVNGSIRVGGAGRSNATPNLNNGKIFIGNASNQSITATLDTSIVVENTNLYYTTTRANTDFDTRLATKDTDDLTEGSNLYYTTARVNSDFDTRLATKSTTNLAEGSNLYYTDARVNSAFDTRLATKDTDDLTEGTTNLYYTSGRANTDFDTRLATKSTTDLAEGTNLYYTTARFDSAFTSKDTDDLSEGLTNLYYTTTRFDSAFGNKTTSDLTEGTNLYYTDTRANTAIDARVTKAFVDALNIQAASVDANSVTLGTDTVGNYVATVTGTANKITVSGSGSESAAITLSLPDDVQIADSLTVAGNLTVNGTLTSLDTTNLDIEDNLFQLNAGLTGSPVNDSGMLINRGTADNSIFMWDESVDKFTLGLTTADGSATGNITLNSLGTLVANLEGNVTGNVTGTVSSLSNHDTADLTEGTNLYYTQARFDSALAAKSTTDLSEGTNLYYTDARFDTRLASKDTDDVSEGTSNLYYTTARFDSAFGGKSTSDLSEGTNLYYTDARVQAVSINNVVEDTTPQLGGNLDLNSSNITGTGDINITGTITSSGNITGTLATAAQPNITSLGTLTGLNVAGTPTFDGLTVDGILAVSNATQTFNGGIATEVNTSIINFGLNEGSGNRFGGSYTQANQGGMLNFDTRAGEPLFQIYGRAAGTASASGTALLNILADGNVGIGTTSPDTLNHLLTSTTSAITPVLKLQGNFTANDSSEGTSIDFVGSADATAVGSRIIGTRAAAGGNMDLRFHTARDSFAMIIDESQNVGIGTTSVTNNTNRTTLGLQGAWGGQLDIMVGSTVHAQFGTDNFGSGQSCRIQSQDGIVFKSGGSTERMRLDNAGNLLVGTTDTAPGVADTNVGVALNSGRVFASAEADYALNLNRNTSDGDILRLRKDGTTVGSIGTVASRLFIGNDDTFLTFQGASDRIYPASSSGGTRDAAIDLGLDGGRFKDLYLSGAAYVPDVRSTTNQYFTHQAGNFVAFRDSNATERMRIDSSGNLLVGTSTLTPNYDGGIRVHSASNVSNIRVSSADKTGFDMMQDTGGTGYLVVRDNASMTFHTNNAERMRLDSSGALAINGTNDSLNGLVNGRGHIFRANGESFHSMNDTGGANTLHVYDFADSTYRFYVGAAGSVAGNIYATNTSITGLSDERLKENIVDLETGLSEVMALQPRRFDWKNGDAQNVAGFVAQEVESVLPELVGDYKHEEFEDCKSLKMGDMIPTLVKAIQEQQELINNLTSRIEELEN